MPELGQTTDPRELIPGEPQAVADATALMQQLADAFNGVLNGLGSIDVPGWTGDASNAFLGKLAEEPPRWARGSDALQGAAEALTGHADTLTWAQEQATQAIELWERGEAATRQATAQFNAAAAAGAVAEFVDPGAALRQRATEILERAREQLAQAGDATAENLARLTEPVRSTNWRAAIGLGSQERWRGRTAGTMRNPQTTQPGAVEVGAEYSRSAGTTYAAEGDTTAGPVTARGRAEAGLEARFDANASVGSTGVSAGVSASSGARASAEGSANYGIVGVNARADAFAGVEAGAELSAGTQGLHAGVDAFAGARVGAELGADVGGLGAGVRAEGWAGVGVEAGLDIGMQGGRFVVGGEFGAALGVGGRIAPQIVIDPAEVADTAAGAADALGDLAGDLNPFD